MDSKCYYVLLSMIEGLGPRRLQHLLDRFGEPQTAWSAHEDELKEVLPPAVLKTFLNKRKNLDPKTEIDKLSKAGIHLVSVNDPEYPDSLRQIYDPPRIIYVKGQLEVLSDLMIAVVGARKASRYGLTVAGEIAGELAENGLTIVSGMARGVDSAAHQGALKQKGKTVAVLGCGVDVVYPKENKKLMEEIIYNGAIVSEFPPGTSPQPGNFPQRNRIISGLSKGVLIIEAAERSGSLITADFALEQGRDVFAVPGQVTEPANRGAHRLIKQGAKLVENARDILDEYGFEPLASQNQKILETGMSPEEIKIFNLISNVSIDYDTLVEKSGFSSGEVLSILTLLEVNDLIIEVPGKGYIRSYQKVF